MTVARKLTSDNLKLLDQEKKRPRKKAKESEIFPKYRTITEEKML